MNTMKQFNFKKLLVIQAILVIGLLTAGCSVSAEKLIQRGNEDFAKQLYEEALEAYRKAQIESPELAQPYYNSANAFYRRGDYFQAVEQLTIALELAEEDALRQNSYYNLGNNSYNSQELEMAVESYKAALLINSDDRDAKYNLELALQQQKQDQQEQEQEKQQQNKDESSENNSSGADENNQDTQGEDSNNQNQQGQGQDQEQQNQDSGSSQEQEEKTGESQEQDQNNSDQNQESNQENQQNKNQEVQDQENNSQDNSQIPAPGQKMTAEQAKQLLAALAQNAQTLQEYLGQILYVQELPPIQDW